MLGAARVQNRTPGAGAWHSTASRVRSRSRSAATSGERGPNNRLSAARKNHTSRAGMPCASTGQRVAYLRGVDVTTAADAILRLVPVDTFVDEPVIRMEVVGAPDQIPEVQRAFHEVVSRAAGRAVRMGSLPRSEFYERVRGAFAVVATSEARPYGCFLLTTGVV